ncbi:sodium:calcium antiporter [bacterium]|nr:sodium:calcium antiporter [bacterium]
MNLTLFFSFIAYAVLLWLGATSLVSGSVKLSKKIGLSDFFIGMTVIAIGTSLPEFFVLFKSAYIKNYSNNLIYGTILGSNMANTCLILGLALIFSFGKEFRYKLQNLNLKYILIILSTFLFYFFSFGIINTTVICLMIILLSTLFYFSGNSADSDNIDNNLSNILIIIYLIFGPVAIWFAAEGITMTGLKIIEQVGLSSALVGSIFLALSTSFPEIIACLISIIKYGKNDFVLGNIIGSNVANFTIFSIINLIFLIPLPSFAISSLSLILIAELVLFTFIVIFRKRRSIPNFCGIFLLLLYIIFVFKV